MRPRAHADGNKCTEQDSRNVIAGNAEGQHGHQGGAVDRVVSRFRCRDAFELALAEFLRLIRRVLGGRVADERRHHLANAGNDADRCANYRRAQNGSAAGA